MNTIFVTNGTLVLDDLFEELRGDTVPTLMVTVVMVLLTVVKVAKLTKLI